MSEEYLSAVDLKSEKKYTKGVFIYSVNKEVWTSFQVPKEIGEKIE